MTVSGVFANPTLQTEASAAPQGIPPRYEAAVQVGAGGMGIVYKARDRETGEIVALKILRPNIAADPAMQENLRKEVCLARKVTHKNVCRIHEFNRSNGLAYISMEFVEGGSLLSLLERKGRLPWSEALRIGTQICAGLGEAHAQGIVHRDLKPANIIIDRSGVAKIMDFGIARPFQAAFQMTSTMIGTPAYMAPEQVAGRCVDARTDVYAVGLLLYALVTSSEAFEGSSPLAVALKQLREFPTPAREVVPGLPAHAEAIILKCIQKDPAKRFQSMDELAAALASVPQAGVRTFSWSTFAADVQRFGFAVYRDVLPRMKEVVQLFNQMDWKFLRNKDKQKVLAAGLAGACLLGGIVFSAPKNSQINQKAYPASLGQSQIGAHDLPPPATNRADANSSVTSLPAQNSAQSVGIPVNSAAAQSVTAPESNLGSVSRLGSQKPSRSNSSSAIQSASGPNGKISRTAGTQTVARDSALPLTAANIAPPLVATPTNSPESPIVPSAAPATNNHVSNRQKIEKTFSGLGIIVRSIVPRTAPADSSFQAKTTNENAAISETYLEVGSFKDSTSADDVADKLTKLGFHATSIRKNVLWKQSYQVRVGPYIDSTELTAAQQEITSDGFKPHPVK